VDAHARSREVAICGVALGIGILALFFALILGERRGPERIVLPEDSPSRSIPVGGWETPPPPAIVAGTGDAARPGGSESFPPGSGERATRREVTPEVIEALESVESPIDDWPGATIRGVVVDSSGVPVAGARIHAFGEEFDGDPVSDEYGCFAVAGLSPGRYDFFACREGYAPTLTLDGHVRVTTGLHEGQARIVLEPVVMLAGIVHDEAGAVVTGAEVESRGIWRLDTPVDRYDETFECAEATTAANGSFVIAVPARGAFEVSARASSLGAVSETFEDRTEIGAIRLDLVSSPGRVGTCGWAFRAASGMDIAVDVEDRGGLRIERANVHVTDAAGGPCRVWGAESDETIVATNVVAGHHEVFVSAAGFGTARLGVDIPPRVGVHRFHVVLPPAGALVGRAFSARDRSLAGVDIGVVDSAGFAHTTSTDRKGAFAVHGVAPGAARVMLLGLRLVGEDRSPSPTALPQTRGVSTEVIVGVDRPATCELFLAESGLARLAGTLRGAPRLLAAATIRVWPGGAEVEMSKQAETTEFTSDLLAPGRYEVEIELDHETFRQTDVELVAGEITTIEMDLETASLHGSAIVAATGAPLRAGEVLLLRRSAQGEAWFERRISNDAITDWSVSDHRLVTSRRVVASGRYSFEAIAPGDYRLLVVPEDPALAFTWREVRIEAGACDTDAIPIPVAASVAIDDPAAETRPSDAEPAFAASLLSADGLRFARECLDVDVGGRLALSGMPSGFYRLDLRESGDDGVSHSFTVTAQ
jgi:hypothetical protein